LIKNAEYQYDCVEDIPLGQVLNETFSECCHDCLFFLGNFRGKVVD